MDGTPFSPFLFLYFYESDTNFSPATVPNDSALRRACSIAGSRAIPRSIAHPRCLFNFCLRRNFLRKEYAPRPSVHQWAEFLTLFRSEQAYEESVMEAERAAQQTDRLVRSIDADIAVICDNYDQVKQTRFEILAELEALNKKQQQEAAANALQQQPAQLHAEPATASAPNASQTAANRTLELFSDLFGIEVQDVKEISASQSEVWFKLDEYKVVVKFRSESAAVSDVRIIPMIPSCAPILQRAVASNDLPYLMREVRERINNLTARAKECESLQAAAGVTFVGATTPRVVVKFAGGLEIELLVHEEYPKPHPSIGVLSSTNPDIVEALRSGIVSGKLRSLTDIVGAVSAMNH